MQSEKVHLFDIIPDDEITQSATGRFLTENSVWFYTQQQLLGWVCWYLTTAY